MLVLALLLMLATPLLTRARGGDAYTQLPLNGPNFSAYSLPLHALGRCYLLAPLTKSVVEAYAILETTCPEQKFIYAEMGWKGGGRFDPHRTHRQGSSADFLTPMRNKLGSAPLPIGVSNRWGYDLRLNEQGEYGGEYEDLKLDAPAVIQHLSALDKSANTHGWKIKRVIFDLPLHQLLQQQASYAQIAHLSFMPGQAWFPHDGHYHVDFEKR